MEASITLYSEDIERLDCGDSDEYPSYITLRIQLFPQRCPLATRNFINMLNARPKSFSETGSSAPSPLIGSKVFRINRGSSMELGTDLLHSFLSKDDIKECIVPELFSGSGKEKSGNLASYAPFPDEFLPTALPDSVLDRDVSQLPGGLSHSLEHLDPKKNLSHNCVGYLSMSNIGENSNGSRFFITLGKYLPECDGKHVIFGKVMTPNGTVVDSPAVLHAGMSGSSISPCGERNKRQCDSTLGGTLRYHESCGTGLDRLISMLSHPQYKLHRNTMKPFKDLVVAHCHAFQTGTPFIVSKPADCLSFPEDHFRKILGDVSVLERTIMSHFQYITQSNKPSGYTTLNRIVTGKRRVRDDDDADDDDYNRTLISDMNGLEQAEPIQLALRSLENRSYTSSAKDTTSKKRRAELFIPTAAKEARLVTTALPTAGAEHFFEEGGGDKSMLEGVPDLGATVHNLHSAVHNTSKGKGVIKQREYRRQAILNDKAYSTLTERKVEGAFGSYGIFEANRVAYRNDLEDISAVQKERQAKRKSSLKSKAASFARGKRAHKRKAKY
eukprot:Tbor_TRINITY_DN5439_c1_g1::TRINITY_DN5439_c1_g1_i1::g.24356::m.24356